MEATRLVRRFQGHRAAITDLQLSSDSRWLMVAMADGHVRVWDVPESRTLQVPSALPSCLCLYASLMLEHACNRPGCACVGKAWRERATVAAPSCLGSRSPPGSSARSCCAAYHPLQSAADHVLSFFVGTAQREGVHSRRIWLHTLQVEPFPARLCLRTHQISCAPESTAQVLVLTAQYMRTELLHASAPPALCSRAHHLPIAWLCGLPTA